MMILNLRSELHGKNMDFLAIHISKVFLMQAGNSGLVEFSSLAGDGGEYQVWGEKITNAIVVMITIFIFNSIKKCSHITNS